MDSGIKERLDAFIERWKAAQAAVLDGSADVIAAVTQWDDTIRGETRADAVSRSGDHGRPRRMGGDDAARAGEDRAVAVHRDHRALRAGGRPLLRDRDDQAVTHVHRACRGERAAPP